MENFRYKGTSRVLNTAASLLLFLIFTVCMLMIIGSGAGIYSRINDGYHETYGSSAAIKYISNKIRSADECEIIENGILLKNGSIITVIYSSDSGIYEKSTSSDNPVSAEGGDKVVDGASMNITDKNGLYEISVICGENASSSFIRKGDTP